LAEDGARNLRWIRVFTHSALDDGQTHTPDVALHTVGTTCGARGRHAASADAFRCHVALAADVRLGDTGNQVTGYAKVADLYLSTAIDEDVGGLDITMNDVMVVLQGLETHYRRVCDLAQNRLWDSPDVQLVDAASVHVLDAHVNRAFLEESTVEVDDVRRYALVEDHQLLEDGRKL
jgi:hypothetical protein